MASIYHKAWVERKNDKLSLLKELIIKYGDNLEIEVDSHEEVRLIRERFNLINAWTDISSKHSEGQLLVPLVLVIKRIGASYGEYDCDWCHGFSGKTNRGYNLDKNEILLYDELTSIVEEIRQEIHG